MRDVQHEVFDEVLFVIAVPMLLAIRRRNAQQKHVTASLPAGRQVCYFLCTNKESKWLVNTAGAAFFA